MKNIRFLGIPIIVLLLMLSFYYFKNQQHSKKDSQVPNLVTNEATATPSLHKTFNLEIINRKLKVQETIQVKIGDDVTLNIISDEAEELHLHGYDLSINLPKEQSAILNFKAVVAGRFIFELENSKTDIGAIEVLP